MILYGLLITLLQNINLQTAELTILSYAANWLLLCKTELNK